MRSPPISFVTVSVLMLISALLGVVPSDPEAGQILLPVQAQAPTASDPGSGNRQLTSSAALLEQMFPTNQAQSATTDSTQNKIISTLLPIKGSVVSVTTGLITQAATAYKAQNPAFQMDFLFGATNAAVKSAFLGGGYDYMISTIAPTAADYAAKPGQVYYPLQANGIAPAFNLPASVTNGATLALSGLTLCRIYRANITMWNDPAIVATNPTMNWAAAAGKPITMALCSSGTATQLAFTTYCKKIDPAFKIVPNLNPVFPTNLYASYKIFPQFDQMNSAIEDLPFSFAMTTLSNAKVVELPIANIINTQGVVLTCNTNSMSLNLFELATNGYAAGSNTYDLTNPSTPQAWPIMTMTYLFLDSQVTLTTCASKKLMLEFFLWFYTSSVVSSIAEKLYLVVFPQIFVSQLQILERLRAEVLCQDAMLVASNGHEGFVGINALAAPLVSLYSSFYLAIDNSRTYTINSASESLMVQRVIAGELEIALVDMQQVSDKDVSLIQSGGAVPIPAFMSGVSPIFTLPSLITAQYANAASTKALGLPALYPLVLNLDVMTSLFLGEIGSWLDPALLALNPQLQKWFTATGADPTLSIVVGATRAGDSLKGALMLFNVMKSSSVAQRPENAGFFPTNGWVSSDGTIITNPFLAVATAPTTVANISIIEVESRLSIKSTMNPGSISYRLLGSASTSTGKTVTDPTVEFQMQITNSLGVTEIVPPTATSMKKCAVPYYSMDGSLNSISSPLSGVDVNEMNAQINNMLDVNIQRNWVNPTSPQPGCWPVSNLLSFVVPMTFTSAVSVASNSGSVSTSTAVANTCEEGTHALEFIHFIQSTPLLSAAAESFGLIRLSESSLVRKMTEQVLYSAMCDDTALLIIQPYYYTIPSTVSSFGKAVSAIGMIIAIVSALVVFTFRSEVVIRSASAPFLLFILSGVGLLFGAIAAWSADPSSQSCAAFSWLANLGFMMLFVPLFLKTWRVWRIFSGAHLKVVKLSNNKLIMIMAVAVLVDLILLSAWQGTSPMTPIQYSKQIGDTYHYYTHCSVNPKGMPFVYLEGIYKCGLLLFGSVMAFSTRNVKGTFNEATQIAWSIYNTLATGLITVVIIVFIAAVETTLIVLVQIFILWLACCTWALLFIPKFHLLFQSEEAVIEASRSDLPQEKSAGFSFASVAVMSPVQLKQYYGALKIQMNKVEKRLGYKVTAFPNGPGESPTVAGGKGARYSRTGNSSMGGETIPEAETLLPDPDVAREQSLLVQQRLQLVNKNVSNGPPSPSRNQLTGGMSPTPRTPHLMIRQSSASVSLAASTVLPNTVEENVETSTIKSGRSVAEFKPPSPPTGLTNVNGVITVNPVGTAAAAAANGGSNSPPRGAVTSSGHISPPRGATVAPAPAPAAASSAAGSTSPPQSSPQSSPPMSGAAGTVSVAPNGVTYVNRSPSPEFSLRRLVMNNSTATKPSSRVSHTVTVPTIEEIVQQPQ